METTDKKPDLVDLVERIAFEIRMFEKLKRTYNKKQRRQEIARINRLISEYNSVIPKAMKFI
jgi:hypothetical protein